MGYTVETDGLGSEWYEQGAASNAVLLQAFMTEGFFFELVAGLELTTVIGCAINWIPAAKEIEIHGLHSVATTPASKNYTIINYTCTSEQSHTQTVNGPTTWTNNGDFNLEVPDTMAPDTNWGVCIRVRNPQSKIVLQVGGDKTGEDCGQLEINPERIQLSSDGQTKIYGGTSASLVSGAGALNVTSDEVSLKCNAAGLTATEEATTLSGAKVEIGVPGTPDNPQVATAATVAATAAPLDVTTAAINNLQSRLRDLQTKIGRSKMLSQLLK